ECALLVTSHQPAVADDICRKDGRKAALNVLFGHRERLCLSVLRCELMAERPGCLSRATIFRVWATLPVFTGIRRIVATTNGFHSEGAGHLGAPARRCDGV